MDLISGLRNQAADAATTHGFHEELVGAFSLAGRTAVVTGAAGGIGRQAAITFAQAGADIVLVDLDESALEESTALVKDLGVTATVVGADVRSKASMDDVAATAVRTHHRLDIWANVAGILHYSPIVEMTEDELRRVVDVNLFGVYWGSAAAGRVMTAAKRGSIINIASAAGDMGSPGASGYGLTKAAVMQFTRTLALELGPIGVRANAIAPGWIETPMTAVRFKDEDGNVDEQQRAATLDQFAKIAPLRITGRPEDISYAMLYLAADASRFVTGQVLRPNGGIVMP